MKFTHQTIPWAAWTSNGVYGGLDIVLGRTAFCVLEYSVLHVYVIDTRPLTGASRLSYIHEAVDHVCQMHEIDLVAIENGAYEAGGRLYELGGANAVGQLAISRNGVEMRLVAPNSLKKFFTGNHEADKRRMIKEANRRFGAKTFYYKQDDEADAFALALLAHGIINPRSLRHRHEMEVAVATAEKGVPHTWTPATVIESE